MLNELGISKQTLTNFVLWPLKTVKSFEPPISNLFSPQARGRWKFKVPQGPIKLPPSSRGKRIPCSHLFHAFMHIAPGPLGANDESLWGYNFCDHQIFVNLYPVTATVE